MKKGASCALLSLRMFRSCGRVARGAGCSIPIPLPGSQPPGRQILRPPVLKVCWRPMAQPPLVLDFGLEGDTLCRTRRARQQRFLEQIDIFRFLVVRLLVFRPVGHGSLPSRNAIYARQVCAAFVKEPLHERLQIERSDLAPVPDVCIGAITYERCRILL
jgi:hypothetical protein